ncbi:MAG TPA: hypothetical protein IAB62_04480, partial [Candidatus Coprocola pullicola]|nr:hypothetical protein [Candidatus Coprocola pullicola]
MQDLIAMIQKNKVIQKKTDEQTVQEVKREIWNQMQQTTVEDFIKKEITVAFDKT